MEELVPAELDPLERKILDLTEEFIKAEADFTELGTPESYEVRWEAEKALNEAVVEKRRERPGASIVTEGN